jgi:hypothetical protein
MKKRILKENSQSWPTEKDVENFLLKYPYSFGWDLDTTNDKSTHYPYRGMADLDEIEQMILSSIAIFTGGHVPSVRDVSKFNKALADNPKDLLPLRKGYRNPDLIDYKIANHVMSILSNRRCKSFEAYRGIGVEKNQAFFDGLKPGVEFNNWPISSFTVAESVAKGFAKAAAAGTDKEPMLIIVENMNRGTSITPYSLFNHEDEFVSSVRLKILDYEMIKYNTRNWHYLNCEAF